MHHYEAEIRRLVLSEAMVSRRRSRWWRARGARIHDIVPPKVQAVFPTQDARADHAAWLHDNEIDVPEIAERLGVTKPNVRVLLRLRGRCRPDDAMTFDTAFYQARQEHLFLLWCEGLSTNEIAARVSGVGKGRVRKLIDKFTYRLGRAMIGTRLTITTTD